MLAQENDYMSHFLVILKSKYFEPQLRLKFGFMPGVMGSNEYRLHPYQLSPEPIAPQIITQM